MNELINLFLSLPLLFQVWVILVLALLVGYPTWALARQIGK